MENWVGSECMARVHVAKIGKQILSKLEDAEESMEPASQSQRGRGILLRTQTQWEVAMDGTGNAFSILLMCAQQQADVQSFSSTSTFTSTNVMLWSPTSLLHGHGRRHFVSPHDGIDTMALCAKMRTVKIEDETGATIDRFPKPALIKEESHKENLTN